jgi:hypothetical protein
MFRTHCIQLYTDVSESTGIQSQTQNHGPKQATNTECRTDTVSVDRRIHIDTMANNYGWLVAVLICVVASTISNFGLNLQKLALTMKQTKSKPPWMYRTTWFCGTAAVTQWFSVWAGSYRK